VTHGNTPKAGTGRDRRPTGRMEESHGPDQLTAKIGEPAEVSCSYCGKSIENSADQNACFGIEPYAYDKRLGDCFECVGDPRSDDIRTQLGWVGRTFYEVRMDIVRERLKPETRAKFDALDYGRKIVFIGRCIERGFMI
jgi:hypothetical protein